MNENPYRPPQGELTASTAPRARPRYGAWVPTVGLLGGLLGLVYGLSITIRNGGFDDLLDGPRPEHVVIAGAVLTFGMIGACVGAVPAAILRPSRHEQVAEHEV